MDEGAFDEQAKGLPFIFSVEPWVRPEFAASVERIVSNWSWMVPRWLEHLTLSYDEKGEYTAQLTVSEEYRSATLCLGGSWAGSFTNREDEHIILHEMCHFYTIPTARAGRSAVGALVPDQESPAYILAFDQITHAMEGSTEDLCRMFLRQKTR